MSWWSKGGDVFSVDVLGVEFFVFGLVCFELWGWFGLDWYERFCVIKCEVGWIMVEVFLRVVYFV